MERVGQARVGQAKKMYSAHLALVQQHPKEITTSTSQIKCAKIVAIPLSSEYRKVLPLNRKQS